MKKHIKLGIFSTLLIPIISNLAISANITPSIKAKRVKEFWQEKQKKGIALFDKKNLTEADYENLINVYETSFKPMGIMGLRKWMIKNPNSYKKVSVAVLDGGHINFDAIIKPKNSNVKYETYDDGELNNLSYHATAVASLIGGVSGINPDVDLYSLGSFSKKNYKGEWDNISTDEFKKKLDWAITKGVKIFNFSFGIQPTYLDFEEEFVEYQKANKDNKNTLLSKIEKKIIYDFSEWAKIMDEYSENHKVIFVNSAGNNNKTFKWIYNQMKRIRDYETDNELISKIDAILLKFIKKEYFLLRSVTQSFNSISVGCLNEKKEIADFSSPINREFEPSKALISAIGHFNFKWNENQKTNYYQKLIETFNNSRTVSGTSYSSPIIAGLISLIISIYDYTIKWTIDAADIKNILVLNSIYAKDTYDDTSSIFNDTMNKYNGILSKNRSGYGLPNWVQIRKYLTKKSKNNKWILIKNKEKWTWNGREKAITSKEKFDIKHNSRFKFSLSWLDSPKTIEDDKESFYKETSNYDLMLRQTFENKTIEYSSSSLYGNHEFIHRIHNSLNKDESQLELTIKYLPDKYDTKRWGRELKVYYKEQ